MHVSIGDQLTEVPQPRDALSGVAIDGPAF
jgi:hypothetical protein